MINILYIIDNNSSQELPIFLNPLLPFSRILGKLKILQRSRELRDNEILLFIEHSLFSEILLFIEHSLFSEIVPNIVKHVLIANLIN